MKILIACVTPDHLLLDSALNIGPLTSYWELHKFKDCWNKSIRSSKILTFLYQKFSNFFISERSMSGPRLGALSNNMWSGVSTVPFAASQIDQSVRDQKKNNNKKEMIKMSKRRYNLASQKCTKDLPMSLKNPRTAAITARRFFLKLLVVCPRPLSLDTSPSSSSSSSSSSLILPAESNSLISGLNATLCLVTGPRPPAARNRVDFRDSSFAGGERAAKKRVFENEECEKEEWRGTETGSSYEGSNDVLRLLTAGLSSSS